MLDAQTVTYTPSDVAASMRRAGFSEAAIPTGVAVATAESGRRTVKSNVDPNSWGVWQINLDFWGKPNGLNSGISQGCALNLDCSTQAAYQISRGGADWSAWSAYSGGSYLNFLNTLNVGPSASPAGADSPSAPQGLPSAGTRIAGLFPQVDLGLLGGKKSTLTIGKTFLTVGVIGLMFVGVVLMVGSAPSAIAGKVIKKG